MIFIIKMMNGVRRPDTKISDRGTPIDERTFAILKIFLDGSHYVSYHTTYKL